MIVAGSPYRRSLNGDYYFVQNMMRHGKHTDHWNDVALIRVTREIHIYDKVQVVALPITNVPRVDDVVALAGWGVIDVSTPSTSYVTRRLTLRSFSRFTHGNRECSTKFTKGT